MSNYKIQLYLTLTKFCHIDQLRSDFMSCC